MASALSFSGLASGIDSQAIIDSTVASARLARVQPNQKKVGELEETNTGLESLETKLDALRTTLQPFSSLSGGGVSKLGSSSRESVVSATATAAASNGSYDITVNSLAKNHTFSYNFTFSSTTTPFQNTLGGGEAVGDRTVTFKVGTGSNQETVNVVITNGTYSATQFVTDFNNAATKAEASLVNVGTEASPSYKIVINSMYEGTEKGLIVETSHGAALPNTAAYTESAATNSSIDIDGIGTVTRGTNSISDVIPGVTFNLQSAGGSTATIKVQEDAAATTAKLQDFVDAFNDIVKFVQENNQVIRDESGAEVTNVFAPLSGTRTDDNALSALRTAIGSAVASGGSVIRVFSDLGITTERDGRLKFDTAKLQSALSSEPSSVSSIIQGFADSVALTGGTIDMYTRFNGLLDLSINNNKSLISELNRRIGDAEKQIQRTADALKQRYARLESLMSKLQQQQSSLSGALGGR
jgi:flagellar hook-associated protein 2